MSNLKLDLDSFKSSGVYTLEYDNTVQETIGADSFRLAVGFTEHGPFNRPVFLSGQSDRKKIFGNINTKLEKRGSFFDRSLDIMLGFEPTIALNLINVDDKDMVGMATFGLSSSDDNHLSNKLISFSEFFDRSKFWIPSTENLNYLAVRETLSDENKSKYKENSYAGPIFNIVNLETQDITVFIVKEQNLAGYNVTFSKWYENMEMPYKWINPNDYVSDYFVRVIAVKGDWTNSAFLASDMTWKEYFDENGLIVSKLGKFISNSNVSLIGSWSGAIMPNFFNKSGKLVSIDSVVNNYTVNTGLMISINENALESITNHKGSQYYDEDLNGVIDQEEEIKESNYKIDMVGHFIKADSGEVSILSYNKVNASDFIKEYTIESINKNKFVVIPDTANDPYLNDINLGALVEGENGYLTKIIKKSYNNGKYEFTCVDNVANTNGESSTYETDAYKIAEGKEIVINGTNPVGKEVVKEDVKYVVYKTEGKKSYALPVEGDKIRITIDPSVNVELNGNYYTVNYEGSKHIVMNVPSLFSINIHKPINEAFKNAVGTKLTGLKITNKHRPGFDKDGNYNVEAGVEKIYSVLNEEGIKRGLKNKDMIAFRYLVDTMDGGINTEMGGKKYLANIAKEVGQCTALINFPSVSLLKSSQDPIFCDVNYSNSISKKFDTKYIPTGGNPDSQSSIEFTLFTKEGGADYSATFAPFLRYNAGGTSLLIPPAAHVSNAFMVKYKGGDPYATIANTNGYLNDNRIVDLEYMFDDKDRDNLEPFGVNPIILQNAKPTIYGNRTCYQEVISDLNYLHVRELLNKLELESRKVLKPFTFRTNNAIVRAECVRSLNPIYEAALLSGAIYSYNIIMDETNNTPEVISKAFGIVDIEITVNKNMEKIIQRISLEKLEY